MRPTTLQLQAQTALRAAETAVAAAATASQAELDRDRRCVRPELNLVNTVTADRWAVIASQLARGNGGELVARGGRRPKFCSAFSSCALAVNAFAPFDATETLIVPGAGSYAGPVEFEAQRSAGVRGYKPNLDLVAEPEGSDWLFGESKCLEYLRPHATDFSDAFVAKAAKVLSGETASVYAAFARAKADGRDRYELLDAAQLLKHFLAARLAAGEQRTVTLVYFFWEPADAADHPAFAAHRGEADDLAASLVDDRARLVPLSYPALWRHWESAGSGNLAEHTAALRARYDVALGTDA